MTTRRYPDDREEHGLQLTFEEFVTNARDLYVHMQDENLTEEEEHRASKKFFRFMLAGRTQIDDVTRHVTLNACQGLEQPEAYDISRDYDSLIGVSTDLPYKSHLALNPVPPFKETLFKPNHMKSIAYRDNRTQFIPMHKIPNFAFAKAATRSVIRVFFPRMYCLNDTPKIPSADMEIIYDQCLQPLIVEHMSTMATHWPVSYSAALTLYRDVKSRIHPGSLDIPAHILDAFGHDYLTRLGELRPYFRDAYFVHELRGWKAATVHGPFDEADRETALSEELLRDLHMDKLDMDDWFVDTAIEIGVAGHIVTWRTSGHKSLLRHCLPTQDDEAIDGLINKQAFNQDRIMQVE